MKAILRRAPLVAADEALVAAAYVLAYLLRFDWEIPPAETSIMWRSLAVVVFTMVLALDRFGLYRRVWRYAGLNDLVHLVSALTVGMLAVGMLIFLAGLRGHSRAVLVMFYPLSLVLVCACRVGVRNLARMSSSSSARGAPSLIVGSGDTGEMVA